MRVSDRKGLAQAWRLKAAAWEAHGKRRARFWPSATPMRGAIDAMVEGLGLAVARVTNRGHDGAFDLVSYPIVTGCVAARG
jgi:hypothetical protein